MRKNIDMSDDNLGIDETLTDEEKKIIAYLRIMPGAQREKFIGDIEAVGYRELKRRQNDEARANHAELYQLRAAGAR